MVNHLPVSGERALDNQENENPNSKGDAIVEKENPIKIKIVEIG